jgi:kynureninase
MIFENSLSFARSLDQNDPLKSFRSQFHIPKIKGKTAIYFAGNSLGLQPKTAKAFVEQELKDWKALGVEGHFRAKRPWLYYHKLTKKTLAQLVGAKPVEVVSMNQLTANLHLMMVSFYRPTKSRFKIITEAGAFSSDQYAFESQLNFHALNPQDALVEISPRAGENTLRTEDIVECIREHGEQTALVLFSGVQYYTGQLFDIKKITETAHRVGAYAGFDLAHAIGNIPLHLHKDKVDFAVWCSYKYLNSGPGGVAGAFVHEKHAVDFTLPRFAGWWGHQEKERFLMKKGFLPMAGADGWQLSNFPILLGAAHLASLEIFQSAGIKNLRKKSEQLTHYAEFLLRKLDPQEMYFSIITPTNPKERGCQLSIFISNGGKKIFDRITHACVVADWREPNVIRIAPVPLYNTFEEVYRFVDLFRKSIS